MNYTDFSAKIKAKYPEYEQVPDLDLTMRMLTKYPQYQEQVDIATMPSPYRANEMLSSGVRSNDPPEVISMTDLMLPQEDIEKQIYKRYTEQKNGFEFTDDMLTANRDYEYPGMSFSAANQMNMKAVKWGRAKTAGTSGVETIKSLARAGQFFSEAFLSRNPLRRKPKEWEKDPLGKRVTDAIIEAVPEAPKNWNQAREQMRQKAAAPLDGNALEVAVGWLDKGGILLLDNLPNMAASTVNPTLGMTVMFANEKNASYEALSGAGVADDIAENMSSMYGMMSAPVEYAENIGRISSAFGVNPKKTLMRSVAGKLKQAGINVGEELVQKFFDDLVYNEAVRISNERDGTDIPLRDLAEGYGETAAGSLAMSTVLEAFGIGAKGIRGAYGMTKGDAQRIRNQNSNEEIDAMVENDVLSPEEGEAAKNPTEENVEAANQALFEGEEITPLEVEDAVQVREAEKVPVAEEAPPRPEVDEEVRVAEEIADVDEIVGISREEKNIVREAQGLEQLDEATAKAQATTLNQAKKSDIDADVLSQDLLENPRPVNDIEVGAMVLREAELVNELESLYSQRDTADKAQNVDESARINTQIKAYEQKLDDLTKASALAGTETARGLASLGMKIRRDSFELVDLLRDARTSAQRTLTEKEQKTFEDGAKKIKELEEKIAKVEKQRREGKIPEKLTDEEVQIRKLKAKLRHKIFDMRPKTAWDKYTDVADFIRAMKLSFDMGYFGRQGGKALLSRPAQAIRAMKGATSTLFSERNFYTIYEKLKQDPDHAKAISAGVEIMDIDAEFERHQEAMNSKLAERAPWVRASNRHMVTGLNLLRFGMFKDYMKKNPDASMEELQGWAKFINEYTGRGTLGGLEKSAHTLTNFILAPRWVTSNWQTIVAERHAFQTDRAGNRVVNKRLMGGIAAEKAKFFTSWLLMAGLFRAMGFEIGEDPEESDFMKFSKDDLKIDMTAGQAQNFRLLFLAAETAMAARGLTDMEENAQLVEVLKRYGMYKLAPSVTVPMELLTAENLVGDERTIAETVIGSAVPIIIENIYQEIKDDMDMQDVLTAAGLEAFGVGAQVYD